MCVTWVNLLTFVTIRYLSNRFWRIFRCSRKYDDANTAFSLFVKMAVSSAEVPISVFTFTGRSDVKKTYIGMSLGSTLPLDTPILVGYKSNVVFPDTYGYYINHD